MPECVLRPGVRKTLTVAWKVAQLIADENQNRDRLIGPRTASSTDGEIAPPDRFRISRSAPHTKEILFPPKADAAQVDLRCRQVGVLVVGLPVGDPRDSAAEIPDAPDKLFDARNRPRLSPSRLPGRLSEGKPIGSALKLICGVVKSGLVDIENDRPAVGW